MAVADHGWPELGQVRGDFELMARPWRYLARERAQNIVFDLT